MSALVDLSVSNNNSIMELEEGVDAIVLDEYKIAFDSLSSQSLSSQVVQSYQELLLNPRLDDVAIKIKEECIYKITRYYTESRMFDNVMNILKSNNNFFGDIAKAKTAKIVRNILNIVADVPDSLDVQISLCYDVVAWCKVEKRTFLRQRIEAKLASLLLQKKDTNSALSIINGLLSELKKLDDKQMLTETHLTESRIYHALRNIPKSKASLTASRTAANAIYVAPSLQAELDETSGILHCEEGDYTTAYSYFLEGYDAYDQVNDKVKAAVCLKYMSLCKILNNTPEEVAPLLTGKYGLKHGGPHIDAMLAIAKAAKSKSLEEYKKAVVEHGNVLKSDDLTAHHIDLLYEKMLESNLLKIIHPYSCVEISYVSQKINLPEALIEKKLSQMILDHRFSGILDQGKGHLVIYEDNGDDVSYSKSIEVITNIGLVVETLTLRAKGDAKKTPDPIPEKEKTKN